MPWQGIYGHDDIVDLLQRAERRGRLASAYLWVGPAGIGKRALALRWARALLCANRGSDGAGCGKCASCQQVEAGTHPDVDLVAKPADRSTIPVDLFIGDPEHRMREGLCHRVALKPFLGGRKIALIDDADFLNEEGANCLLKTLEEPPPGSILILLGSSADRQLPTIRSRCQVLRFRPLDPEIVARLLLERELASDAAEAQRLAAQSGGSLEQALLLADPELWAFRRRLYDRLTGARLESVELARETAAFVEAAGKEASPRRARFRQVMGFAVELYRQALRRQAAGATGSDAELERAVDALLRVPQIDSERLLDCLERCLEGLAYIDRNANQNTLVDAWVDAVAQAAAGRPAPVGLGG
jgi:DNA polymerase-3 subunit delta'